MPNARNSVYDVLKEVNPRIVYGAISGFGNYGPLHERPGYDIIAQAMSGLMSLIGEEGGGPHPALSIRQSSR